MHTYVYTYIFKTLPVPSAHLTDPRSRTDPRSDSRQSFTLKMIIIMEFGVSQVSPASKSCRKSVHRKFSEREIPFCMENKSFLYHRDTRECRTPPVRAANRWCWSFSFYSSRHNFTFPRLLDFFWLKQPVAVTDSNLLRVFYFRSRAFFTLSR